MSCLNTLRRQMSAGLTISAPVPSIRHLQSPTAVRIQTAEYLSEVWINNNLSSDHKDFARQILYEEELLRLNYYVLEELRNLPEGAYYYDNELFHICTN